MKRELLRQQFAENAFIIFVVFKRTIADDLFKRHIFHLYLLFSMHPLSRLFCVLNSIRSALFEQCELIFYAGIGYSVMHARIICQNNQKFCSRDMQVQIMRAV